MLKYQEFINEKQNNLKSLAWSQKSYEHALRFRIPITTKIGKLLNDSAKITSFHITSIDNILNIRSLVARKKSISTFTEMSKNFLEGMDGIQTEGSVLFQFESDLLINSDYDIMSRPDEQGRRWISPNDLVPRNKKIFNVIWKDFSEEIDKKFSQSFQRDLYNSIEEYDEEWIKRNSKEIGNYLNYYIRRAEEVVLSYKEEFLKMFQIPNKNDYSWNEVLVNNIKVKDVLLYHKFEDTYFIEKMVRYFGTLEKLKETLESFATGEVFITFNPAEAVKFVDDRKK